MLLALVVAVAVQVVGVLANFRAAGNTGRHCSAALFPPIPWRSSGVALGLLFTWLGLAIGYFTPYPSVSTSPPSRSLHMW